MDDHGTQRCVHAGNPAMDLQLPGSIFGVCRAYDVQLLASVPRKVLATLRTRLGIEYSPENELRRVIDELLACSAVALVIMALED